MSLVPNLPLHAEAYGACALSRSRRLALMFTCGLCLALVALSQVQPKRSVRIAAAPPLYMDMRTLPEAATAVEPQAEQKLRPILAEQSPLRVAVSPVPPTPVQPEEASKAETIRPPEKAKTREVARRVPKVRETKPLPKPAPAVSPAAESATAVSAAVPAASSTAQAGQAMGQASVHAPIHAPVQALGQASEQEKDVALAVLMQAIERYKSYPKQARRTGAQGTVSLLVHVGQDGKVKGWEMRQGSGHVVLDSATRQLGEKLAGLDTGLRGKDLRVVVPVRYALR